MPKLLARLLTSASFDLRRKIAVSGRRPLASADYGHRRKIVVSVRSDSYHRRKIVVSGRTGMLLVVVLLLVVPMGGVTVGVVLVDNEVLSRMVQLVDLSSIYGSPVTALRCKALRSKRGGWPALRCKALRCKALRCKTLRTKGS